MHVAPRAPAPTPSTLSCTRVDTGQRRKAGRKVARREDIRRSQRGLAHRRARLVAQIVQPLQGLVERRDLRGRRAGRIVHDALEATREGRIVARLAHRRARREVARRARLVDGQGGRAARLARRGNVGRRQLARKEVVGARNERLDAVGGCVAVQRLCSHRSRATRKREPVPRAGAKPWRSRLSRSLCVDPTRRAPRVGAGPPLAVCSLCCSALWGHRARWKAGLTDSGGAEESYDGGLTEHLDPVCILNCPMEGVKQDA